MAGASVRVGYVASLLNPPYAAESVRLIHDTRVGGYRVT
jgi:hypothetical protein